MLEKVYRNKRNGWELTGSICSGRAMKGHAEPALSHLNPYPLSFHLAFPEAAERKVGSPPEKTVAEQYFTQKS
jgi:hypothetical protein